MLELAAGRQKDEQAELMSSCRAPSVWNGCAGDVNEAHGDESTAMSKRIRFLRANRRNIERKESTRLWKCVLWVYPSSPRCHLLK